MKSVEPSSIKEYDKFVMSQPVVLIHFWAEWNSYDDSMRALLKNLHIDDKEFSIGFVNTDLDEMKPLCRKLKILNLPTLIFYKNGHNIGTQIGMESEDAIYNKLKELVDD